MVKKVLGSMSKANNLAYKKELEWRISVWKAWKKSGLSVFDYLKRLKKR